MVHSGMSSLVYPFHFVDTVSIVFGSLSLLGIILLLTRIHEVLDLK